MELLECMQRGGKSWEMYVFSSANAIRKYTMEELVRLGVSWVWMGLESEHSEYAKLSGTDTQKLTAELRKNGIRVLGSTIVAWSITRRQHRGRDRIRGQAGHRFPPVHALHAAAGHAVRRADGARGAAARDTDYADIHGQYKFNWKHPHISRDESKELLDGAFRRDYERNGPSLYRLCRTTLEGWKRYRKYPTCACGSVSSARRGR